MTLQALSKVNFLLLSVTYIFVL